MRWQRFLGFMVLAAFVFLTPGCSRPTGKPRFAFVSNNNAGFWTYAEKGCDKAASDFDVVVDFRRPNPGTLAQQQSIIENLLNVGVKGIAVSPNDPASMATFLKSEVGNKVTIIAADNDLPDPDARRVYVGTHNYRAGRAAGELVKKAIPKGGKIAVFVGKSDSTNAIERRQGVLDVLAGIDQDELKKVTPFDAADLKLGDGKYVLVGTRIDGGSESACRDKAEDLLAIQPDIDCLVGLWEYNPPALLSAVERMQSKKKPAIVGFDENFQTMDGIKDGKIIGSVAQDPFRFGYESIKILAHLNKGDDGILKKYTMDNKNRIYIEHTVVTPANVDAFYANLKKLQGKEK